MSPLSKAYASFAVAALLSSPAGAQGVVTQKNISLKRDEFSVNRFGIPKSGGF
jgi:hypothetical protein